MENLFPLQIFYMKCLQKSTKNVCNGDPEEVHRCPAREQPLCHVTILSCTFMCRLYAKLNYIISYLQYSNCLKLYDVKKMFFYIKISRKGVSNSFSVKDLNVLYDVH
jgi:hypothetical protein